MRTIIKDYHELETRNEHQLSINPKVRSSVTPQKSPDPLKQEIMVALNHQGKATEVKAHLVIHHRNPYYLHCQISTQQPALKTCEERLKF